MRTLALLLSLLPLACALDLRGQLVWNHLIPDSSSLPPRSRVSLDFGEAHALVRTDGSFLLPDVSPGKHILTPTIPGFSVPSLTITIPDTSDPSSDAQGNPHVSTFHPAQSPPPTSAPSLPYPIQLSPIARDEYYTVLGGANVLGMLKNPMVLMMLFSAGMMFFMPKIMASVNMDPELAAEVAATRKKMHGGLNMDWSEGLSNMLAGATSEAAPAAVAPAGTPSRPATAATPGGGGGAKKRNNRR